MQDDLLVVALGGNAIQRPDGEDSVAADFARTAQTARHLAAVARAGRRLVVTHGNGPQVGNHLLRAESAHVHDGLPLLPLDVCVADTQGGMGYMIQQCLVNALHAEGLPGVVATVVTQVLVDARDPAFSDPSKPIGEMIAPDRLDALRAQGWVIAYDERRQGYRRVVASPRPQEILEAEAIRALVAAGVVTIAAGGGGVPVVQSREGELLGVGAVVDKDLASALLAADLDAGGLLILTDVDRVYRRYGKPDQEPIDEIDVASARALLAQGEFPSGSMGPKVAALCDFVSRTGRFAAIAAIEGCEAAVAGAGGTRVVP